MKMRPLILAVTIVAAASCTKAAPTTTASPERSNGPSTLSPAPPVESAGPLTNREVEALARGAVFSKNQLRNLVVQPASVPSGYILEPTASGPVPKANMFGPATAQYQTTFATGDTMDDSYIYSSVSLYTDSGAAERDLADIRRQTMASTSRETTEDPSNALLPPDSFAYTQGPETEGGAGGPLAAQVWREGNAVFRLEVGLNDPTAKTSDLWKTFERQDFDRMVESVVRNSLV